MFLLLWKPTSPRDTELISAARESEKEADIKFFAPWMLRLMICPFSSSFCSFRLRLSYREVAHYIYVWSITITPFESSIIKATKWETTANKNSDEEQRWGNSERVLPVWAVWSLAPTLLHGCVSDIPAALHRVNGLFLLLPPTYIAVGAQAVCAGLQ